VPAVTSAVALRKFLLVNMVENLRFNSFTIYYLMPYN